MTRTALRARQLGAAVILVIGGGSVTSSSQASPLDQAPVDDGVVAQTLVALDPGTYEWSVGVAPLVAAADGNEASPVPAAAVTFVVVQTGAVTVGEDSPSPTLLGSGQAAVLAGGDPPTITSTVDGSVLLHLGLDVADEGTAGSFSLDSGRYDVELVRRVLAPGGTLALADGAAPTLIRTDRGSVLVADDLGTTATTIDAETSSVHDGNLTVVNTSTAPVAVVAARISGPIAPGEAPDSTTASEPAAAIDDDPPTPTSTPAAPLSPTTSTATASTTPGPTTPSTTPGPTAPGSTLDPATAATQPSSFRDADGDGLTDAEEASLGSNPNDADTDSDDLGDLQESAISGTSLTNWDTDGDGAGDGYELVAGSDPLDPASVP